MLQRSNFRDSLVPTKLLPLLREALQAMVLVLALLLASSASVAAELNVSRNQLPVNLGQYLDYFEDPDSEYTISEIMGDNIPWQRSGQAIPTLGISASSYWFSLQLTSEELASEKLLLVLEAPTLDLIEFYIAHGDQIVWQ